MKTDDGKRTFVVVDRQMQGRALIPHSIAERPRWGDEEVAIRDAFDDLPGRLSDFETMIGEGLIKFADISPYLKYWAR